MKLSVIIVNYNVQHFLKQCLHSVKKAVKNIPCEIIVVDNSSVDGSCAMLEKEFPEVILIRNTANAGFSKANNQGIRIAKGEYVLLLNPDTIVQEDTFAKCIGFMDSHTDAGALGVKMIDGKGHFLPESKRGLPTPSVAFYRVFGISMLFPRSGFFNKYHLGNLDKNKTHEVDVLSGAFMFIRKTALDKTGLLDETFFMYGEDIDLSYRLQKSEFKNYYFPETTIIHYKGESTRKGSINYTLMFYNAMIIFARKHYSRYYAGFFSLLIHIGIYFRAFLSMIKNTLKKLAVPIADSLLIFSGFFFIASFWGNIIFARADYYPSSFFQYVVPSYIIVWILSIVLYGGYDRPYHLKKIAQGLITGSIIILAIYGLLPIHLRFSRAIILIGSLWSLFALTGYRMLLHLLKLFNFRLGEFKKRVLLIGGKEETQRMAEFLKMTHLKPEIAGWISPFTEEKADCLGTLEQYDEIIRIHKIEEVIFSAKDISSQRIIELMLQGTGQNMEFKIAPPESLAIIGSNSIHTSGDLYLINLNSINKIQNRRKKRIFDLITSFIFIITWPLYMLFIPRPFKAFSNILSVFSGIKTWVGYYTLTQSPDNDLPHLRPGIFSPDERIQEKDELNKELKNQINIIYAKDYKAVNDFMVLCRNIRSIGK